MDPRGNTFAMTLEEEGDSWECTYTSRSGGSGKWEGKRAGGQRKPGSKLSTRGAASNRDVFDRLVAPKSRAKAEAEREAVLGESIRSAMTRTGAGFDALGDGAPSLAVGDPYLDSTAVLSASSSRRQGRQLQGGAPSAFRGEATQGAADTREQYMDCPFEDRAELSRRLRRERLAKAKASGVSDRPAFSPASKDPGASALFGAPTLSSVPPGTVGKGLFELARQSRKESAKPRRRRATDAEKDRPAFSSAAASSLGPLARQRHWGLTLTDEDYERASAAGDRAEEGRARRRALARVGDERPAFKAPIGTSPLDGQRHRGLIPLPEQAEARLRELKHSGGGRRPLSAPLRPRGKATPAQPGGGSGGERPPFATRVAPARGAAAVEFEHLPEGSPDDRRKRPASARAAAHRDGGQPPFRPTGPRGSKLTQTVALRVSNLR